MKKILGLTVLVSMLFAALAQAEEPARTSIRRADIVCSNDAAGISFLFGNELTDLDDEINLKIDEQGLKGDLKKIKVTQMRCMTQIKGGTVRCFHFSGKIKGRTISGQLSREGSMDIQIKYQKDESEIEDLVCTKISVK